MILKEFKEKIQEREVLENEIKKVIKKLDKFDKPTAEKYQTKASLKMMKADLEALNDSIAEMKDEGLGEVLGFIRKIEDKARSLSKKEYPYFDFEEANRKVVEDNYKRGQLYEKIFLEELGEEKEFLELHFTKETRKGKVNSEKQPQVQLLPMHRAN